MRILFWIIAIYLLTVVISLPVLIRSARREDPDTFKPYNPVFVAIILSFIPVWNMQDALKEYKYELVLWLMARKLRRMGKKYDKTDPETAKALKNISNMITELKNTKEE